MLVTGDQYQTQFSGTTSTGSLLSVSLNRSLAHVTVWNDGTLPLRVTFTSSAASTSDHEVRPGEAAEVRRAPTSKFGVMTTSTSTDSGDHRRFRVLGMGA